MPTTECEQAVVSFVLALHGVAGDFSSPLLTFKVDPIDEVVSKDKIGFLPPQERRVDSGDFKV